MDRFRVAILIPALNESATIERIVGLAIRYGRIIVIDDGSVDDTAILANKAGALVISHNECRGYESALNTGFKKAAELGAKIVITLDADGQHDPLLIQKFIDVMNSGNDFVVGVRSKRQRLAEHIFAWYTRYRFGINDPLCGMKAYGMHVYNALGHFDSYGSVGTELAIFAAKNHYLFKQISIDVHERNGESRFGKMILGNYKIFRAMMLSI
jgi:glycosyltransferase involved in cell wall biosynthesis